MKESQSKQLEEQSKVRFKKIEILNRIIIASNEATNFFSFLDSVLSCTLELMDFEGGAIYIADRNEKIIEMASEKGLPADFVERVKRVRYDVSPRDIVLIKGQPIFTENYPKIDPENSKKWGILSLASIPLFSKEEIVGALNIASKSRYIFSEEEKDTLQYIGREIGSTIAKMKSEEALRDSEKKYRSLLESSKLGIMEVNVANEKLSYMNQNFLDLVGYSRGEFNNRNLTNKIIHPEDFKILDPLEAYQNLEFRLINKNGNIIWVSGTRINQYDKDGKIETIRLWIEDITQRKHMMDELRTYKERYSLASSAGKSGVWDWNIKTGDFYLDPAVKGILGYRDDEIPNDIEAWSTHFHPDEVDRVNNAARAHMEGKTGDYHIEYRMIHKDGSIRWIDVQGKILRDSEGKAVRFVGTDTDITERRNFEEALRDSEDRFHTVISNAPVVIWAIDREGMFTLSEGKGLEGLGLKPREAVGQSLFEMYRDYPEVIKDVNKALSGESFTSINQVGKATYETKYQPIRDKDGTVIGVSSVSIDVTERQLAEQLIKEQIQKLSELNKLKTDLLRRTSHELKTPLISIKGYADLLLTLHAEKLDDDVFSIVEEIKRGSLRLEGLVKDLLESSKLESGKTQLKVIKEDLTFLIKFCIEELRLLAKKRNHEIFVNIHDKLITLFEKEKIYDVVNNLLSNAIKYTPPGGTIEVKSEIKDGFYIISVSDNGIGIEKDEKPILFQQFGKIERFGRGWDVEPGGTGLGLYISRKIVELHGGNIWLESEGINKGSTFYFSLPIRDE